MSTHKTVAERNRNTVRSRQSVSDSRFGEKSSLTDLRMRKGVLFSKENGTTKKVSKGVRGMPRLLEAKKDVLSCEKLRGSAKTK